MNDTGILVLAAGNSSRLGSPKQLLAYHHQSLLEHVVEQAGRAGLSPLAIVTGAYHEAIMDALRNKEVNVFFNSNWEQGMGTSIVAGISGLSAIYRSLESLVIAVSDQPFVSSALFVRMIDVGKQTGKGIVACSYSDTLGVPVMFNKKYFDLLLGLKGDEGAKKLVQLHHDDVAELPFPEGAVDIDTVEQYERLVNGGSMVNGEW